MRLFPFPLSAADRPHVSPHWPPLQVLTRIRAHLASDAYRRRVSQIEAANLTGILIPAGGSRYMTNLLVTLKVWT